MKTKAWKTRSLNRSTIKNKHDKLKKCYKPLLKEYETQIETINNDETAIDESKSEIDHMNVTVADLNYALNKVQEAIRVTDYYADNQWPKPAHDVW